MDEMKSATYAETQLYMLTQSDKKEQSLLPAFFRLALRALRSRISSSVRTLKFRESSTHERHKRYNQWQEEITGSWG